MATKKNSEFEEALHIGSGRVGLAVMRMQPPHRGHMNLINQMRQDCDVCIIAFGTTQISRVVRHPFTFSERLDMVRAVFGTGIKPLPLVDINSNVQTDDWVDYVLDKVRKLNLPEPTDYYTGSVQDAKWYVNRFAQLSDPATEVGFVKTYHSAQADRRLHIIDRSQFDIPPAEEIRSLIERRDPEWKLYVPQRLINYIEWNYPPELRLALSGPDFPDISNVPPGTRYVRDGKLYELSGEGKWIGAQTELAGGR